MVVPLTLGIYPLAVKVVMLRLLEMTSTWWEKGTELCPRRWLNPREATITPLSNTDSRSQAQVGGVRKYISCKEYPLTEEPNDEVILLS